jgi:hypothetical protein
MRVNVEKSLDEGKCGKKASDKRGWSSWKLEGN